MAAINYGEHTTPSGEEVTGYAIQTAPAFAAVAHWIAQNAPPQLQGQVTDAALNAAQASFDATPPEASFEVEAVGSKNDVANMKLVLLFPTTTGLPSAGLGPASISLEATIEPGEYEPDGGCEPSQAWTAWEAANAAWETWEAEIAKWQQALRAWQEAVANGTVPLPILPDMPVHPPPLPPEPPRRGQRRGRRFEVKWHCCIKLGEFVYKFEVQRGFFTVWTRCY